MSIFIFPGGVSPPMPLLEALRESHDAYRAAVLARIAKRDAAGAARDTNTDFAALAAALAAADGVEALHVAQRVLEQTARHTLRDPGEFVPDARLEGVRVRFVAVADAEREQLLADIIAHEGAERRALEADDENAARLAARGLAKARARFVSASVDEVAHGDDVLRPRADAYALAVLEASGLMLDVFVAARDYQGLSLGKGGRFGRLVQPA